MTLPSGSGRTPVLVIILASLIQSRGGEVIQIRPGDTVHTPPGEWHWHGATQDHFMTHLAMWEGPGEGQGAETEWGELITDEEYHAAPTQDRS